MKNFLTMLVMVALLCACVPTQPYQPPVACQDGAPSLILSVVGDNPKLAGDALIIANIVALDKAKGRYTTSDALKVLDNIEEYANMGKTYADIVAYAIEKMDIANGTAGVAVFLMSDYSAQLSQPIPISDCDRALLTLHLMKQRTALMIFGAGK